MRREWLGLGLLGALWACGDDPPKKAAEGEPTEQLTAELTAKLRQCELLTSDGAVHGKLAARPEQLPEEYGACVDDCFRELAEDCDALAEMLCDEVVSEQHEACVTACNRVENRCDAGKTVFFWTLVCDGFPDCADRTDEQHCLELTGNCDDGQALYGYGQICNGIDDCSDGSDEADCPFLNVCDDGFAVPLYQRCDGLEQCLDGSDEQGCDKLGPELFKCESGGVISREAVCDLSVDCPDASDEGEEQGCAELLCPSVPFQCRDGGTVAVEKFCDGKVDCDDGSDELNCEAGSGDDGDGSEGAGESSYGDGGFVCSDGEDVPDSYVCDGWTDCPEGEDELGC